VLFSPARHEPLVERTFSEPGAREAIGRIAARAQREVVRDDGRWPLDPADAEREGERPGSGVYHGAAGIAWALDELASAGYVEPELVDGELVEALEARMVAEPDEPDLGVGGVWTGLAGVLAVAERRRPDEGRRHRLAELARSSLDSPALETMYGHPGHMALAAELHIRTGEKRWATFWSAGADRLFETWHYDEALGAWLWTQRLGPAERRFLGPAHGLVGNVHVLRRGGPLLAADRQAEAEHRTLETLSRLAVVDDGLANWPAVAGDPLAIRGGIRLQWCHGAAGVLTGLWDLAPDDEAWSELLLAAGRLVWEAGPIRAQPGLCHGTAGNAYALLALWRRTGDDDWLERARAFAAHAAAQLEERVARLGHGRHSLFTGDEGVALCLASCITGDARLPIADRLL
jgi:hypothetical protein